MKLHINRAEDPLQASLPTQVTCVDGIYIHIPYCTHKCHYCDFYSLTAEAEDDQRDLEYVSSLLYELDFYRRNLTFTQENSFNPSTLFIGGGTPSLLSEAAIAMLFKGLDDRNLLSTMSELTVEVNPETATRKKIEKFKNSGINRISMGAQSFNKTHLKTLERLHEPTSVAIAFENARAAGIENINMDLIFAIPGQTMDELLEDLETALAINPTHLSCYSLIFEPETALEKRRELGQIAPIDNELEAQMYEKIIDYLADSGYEHYEISNWAQKACASKAGGACASDYQCQHNLVYWRNQNWLGLGPYAGTHLDGWRWKNKPALSSYLSREAEERPVIIQGEAPTPERAFQDSLLMGLRLKEGVSIDLIQQIEANPRSQAVLQDLLKRDLMVIEGDSLRFTQTGLLHADTLISELIY